MIFGARKNRSCPMASIAKATTSGASCDIYICTQLLRLAALLNRFRYRSAKLSCTC